jgi:hypothetical protein
MEGLQSDMHTRTKRRVRVGVWSVSVLLMRCFTGPCVLVRVGVSVCLCVAGAAVRIKGRGGYLGRSSCGAEGGKWTGKPRSVTYHVLPNTHVYSWWA